jgi:hypothetical protein
MDAERAHLQRMIELLSSNLYTYEEQEAALGSHVPPFTRRQIKEARAELERVKEQLAHLDMSRPDQRIAQIPEGQPPGVIVEVHLTTEIPHPVQIIRVDEQPVVAIYLSMTDALSPTMCQSSLKPECAWRASSNAD